MEEPQGLPRKESLKMFEECDLFQATSAYLRSQQCKTSGKRWYQWCCSSIFCSEDCSFSYFKCLRIRSQRKQKSANSKHGRHWSQCWVAASKLCQKHPTTHLQFITISFHNLCTTAATLATKTSQGIPVQAAKISRLQPDGTRKLHKKAWFKDRNYIWW